MPQRWAPGYKRALDYQLLINSPNTRRTLWQSPQAFTDSRTPRQVQRFCHVICCSLESPQTGTYLDGGRPLQVVGHQLHTDPDEVDHQKVSKLLPQRRSSPSICRSGRSISYQTTKATKSRTSTPRATYSSLAQRTRLPSRQSRVKRLYGP